MVQMSLRSRSHIKAFVVLTRADHLFIHNYIKSILNIILRPILMVRLYESYLGLDEIVAFKTQPQV